ncbi:hypothetical protein ACOSQ2_031277 [Xanthoceras sorbifolium]
MDRLLRLRATPPKVSSHPMEISDKRHKEPEKIHRVHKIDWITALIKTSLPPIEKKLPRQPLSLDQTLSLMLRKRLDLDLPKKLRRPKQHLWHPTSCTPKHAANSAVLLAETERV